MSGFSNSRANCANRLLDVFRILKSAKLYGINSWILIFSMSLRGGMKLRREKLFHKSLDLTLNVRNSNLLLAPERSSGRPGRSEDGSIVRMQSKRYLPQVSTLSKLS